MTISASTHPSDHALQTALESGQLRIGFPMWHLPTWQGQWLSRQATGQHALQEYAMAFDTVEGNTTFYGIPSAERLHNWAAMVGDKFRFIIKYPKTISHSDDPIKAFAQYAAELDRVQQCLGPNLGALFLQLPASIGAEHLPLIKQLIKSHQSRFTDIDLVIELRHLAFFQRDHIEQECLRLLADHHVSRVTFDSRGLFQDQTAKAEILDAQRKKPRMPVHPIGTGKSQLIRFIGHSSHELNKQYLCQWQTKILHWLSEGRQVFFCLHTAGNHDVFELYRYVCDLWSLKPPLLPKDLQQPSLL